MLFLAKSLCRHHTTLSDGSEGNKGHKMLCLFLHNEFLLYKSFFCLVNREMVAYNCKE